MWKLDNLSKGEFYELIGRGYKELGAFSDRSSAEFHADKIQATHGMVKLIKKEGEEMFRVLGKPLHNNAYREHLKEKGMAV